MVITFDIPKRVPSISKRTFVHLGFTLLYASLLFVILVVGSLVFRVSMNWLFSISLSFLFFIFFYFESAVSLGIWSENRGWGEYTLDETGITIVRDEVKKVHPWSSIEKFSVSSFTDFQTRIPFNESLFPKQLHIQKAVSMQIMQFFKAKKFYPFLEVPVYDKALESIRQLCSRHLFEFDSMQKKLNKLLG